MKTLETLFLNELADMYDAERRILKALPKMAKAAASAELRGALQSHGRETAGHLAKLDQVFRCFEQKPKGKACKATIGLLEEGDEIAAAFKDSPAIDAALISAAQKVELYEVASYGCLHAWAEVLGNRKAVGLLSDILGEEKAADEALTQLARSSSNREALGEPGKAQPGNGNGSPGRGAATPRRAVRPAPVARVRTPSPTR